MKGKESGMRLGGSLLPLRVVVVLCGAILMALEMVGVRILTVHFGSTQYVWGATIGVFLGSLSVGYYLGGILADRHPRHAVLGGVILVAAALIFLIPWIANPVCQGLSDSAAIGPKARALLSSIILYFLPSVALGMVSPFAVRLAAHSVEDIGQVAGRLYALSTMGSITGTLLASFVLVEMVGSRATIWGLALALVLTAAILLLPSKRVAGVLVMMLLAIPAWFGTRGSLDLLRGEYRRPFLEEFESTYHYVTVAEGKSYVSDAPSRFMFFNNLAQSGIELEPEDQVVTACGYTDMLHIGMPFLGRYPESMLVVGCGGGVGPSVFRQDYPSLKLIDVVDIDAAVFDMARKYFRYPQEGADSVIRSHVLDGRLFIRNCNRTYDYVVLDAYSSGGQVPFHLMTREFFTEVEKALSVDGVLVINLISAVEGSEGRLLRSTLKTLRSVFPQVYAFPRYFNRNGTRAENIAIVASQEVERHSAANLRERLKKFGTPIPRERLLRNLTDNLIEAVTPFPEDTLLTDDFAPTDSMTYN